MGLGQYSAFPYSVLSLNVIYKNFIDSELDQLMRRSGGVLLLVGRFYESAYAVTASTVFTTVQ